MFKMLIAGAAGVALALPVAPALASQGHDGEAKSRGTCTDGSQWKLKAEKQDSGVKVEFDVESGVAQQAWDYVLSGPNGQIAAGTATTDSDGEFEVKAKTAGSVTDAFTAQATSAAGTCDAATSGVADSEDGKDDGQDDSGDDQSDDVNDDQSDDHSDDQQADDQDETVDEGTCSADSAIALTTKKAGKKRVATLQLKSAAKGQKWRYQIKRGNKVVGEGVARTKGKKATFKVKAKAKGKGALTADAYRVDGDEDCTTDD